MYYDGALNVAVSLAFGFVYPPVAVLGAAASLALWKGRELVLRRRLAQSQHKREGTRPPSILAVVMCGGTMWACVVLVFSARAVQGGQYLLSLGPVVSMTLSMCVCFAWHRRWSRIGAADAAGVVRNVEGAGREGGAETTLSSRLLGDAWNVASKLDALAAAYAEHHGSEGGAAGVGGSDAAVALANDEVPDTVTSSRVNGTDRFPMTLVPEA